MTEYYDHDSGLLADRNTSGVAAGHLHDTTLTWNWGSGDYGLGSESGLAHKTFTDLIQLPLLYSIITTKLT